MSERVKLMHRINVCGFAVKEANLFLDTHPEDKEALCYLRKYSALRKEAEEEYVSKYGPLTMDQATSEHYYDWVKGPWPWEVEFNV